MKRERSFCREAKDAGIFSEVQKLLNTMENEQPSAIAISIGPGMFTSLRVGLALAKGLHISRNIPICGVNTLQVIAHSFLCFDAIDKEKKVICAPIMEAFQGEVFVAFYNRNTKIGQDMACSPAELIHFINRKFKNKTIFAIGPGTKILSGLKIVKDLKNDFHIVDSYFFYPSSSKVVYAALPRIKNGLFDDPENLEPYYIKKTSAEIKKKR